MARKSGSSRQFSPADRFIIEFDRLLAAGIGPSRPAPLAARPADDVSRELRGCHNNAAAGLGLRRGLAAAAQSSAALTRANDGERAAADTLKWVNHEMNQANTRPGPLAAIGYAGGFAIGISSRLLGDEAGRRIAGSHDQVRAQSQHQRANTLAAVQSNAATKPLINGLRQRASTSTCLCGPHGHRVRSRPMTRLLSRFISTPTRTKA